MWSFIRNEINQYTTGNVMPARGTTLVKCFGVLVNGGLPLERKNLPLRNIFFHSDKNPFTGGVRFTGKPAGLYDNIPMHI